MGAVLNPWTVRVTQSQAKNLSTDIRTVGTAIRDWVTPFYTLGGVTTFVITVLTLIDSSGWLVRAITAALILLTIVACAHAWVRSRATADATADARPAAGPKLHTAMLIISLFFCVGLLVSEALMHEKRKGAGMADTPRAEAPTPAEPQAPLPQPAPTSTPTATQEAPAPAKPAVAEPPAQPAVAAPVPAAPTPAVASPAAAARPSTAPADAPAKIDKKEAPAPVSRAPAAIKEEAPKKPSKPSPASNDSATTAEPARPKPPKAAALPARCSDIMVQFSAGRSLSDSDKQYLETSCR